MLPNSTGNLTVFTSGGSSWWLAPHNPEVFSFQYETGFLRLSFPSLSGYALTVRDWLDTEFQIKSDAIGDDLTIRSSGLHTNYFIAITN